MTRTSKTRSTAKAATGTRRSDRTRPPSQDDAAPAAPEVKVGHGGARAGAGRKRSRLPDEVIAAIGQPPTESPLKMARWWQSAGAHLSYLLLQGLVPPRLVDRFRSNAATYIKALPADILHEADKLLRGEEDAREDDAGAELEDVDDGEQLAGG